MRKKTSTPEKFYKINPETGCWEWFGNTCIKGYGKYKVGIKSYKAHRFMYEERFGKIPKGMQIDHKCKVKNCVNPDHLEVVTGTENIRRSSVTKITRAQAIQIHKKYKTKKFFQSDLAKIFNIDQTQISRILLKKSWSDITEEEINASEET